MFKRLLGICLMLGFGMALIAGCQEAKKCHMHGPQAQAMKEKCSDIYVRCPCGKHMFPMGCLKAAKKAAAAVQGSTVVNMMCPCGKPGAKDIKKMVDGVEQHYCCKGCMSKGS